MEQFVVLHRAQPSPWSWVEERGDWAAWGTCLRQIAIGRGCHDVPELEAGDQIHVDMDAYRHLLEIVCGLHSPVVGETEVFGQFKRFVEGLQAGTSSVKTILPLLYQLIGDAKSVRHRYLVGLGSQSYGSLIRREIKPGTPVHIVGGGHLAQEILPWLTKQSRDVTLHVRTPGKVRGLNGAVEKPFRDSTAVNGALVLAAPLSARELEVWLDQRLVNLEKIIDLRGEGQFDPLVARAPVLDLAQVMQKLSTCRAGQSEVIEQARQEILTRAQAFASSAKVRPLGWDDLCA